MAHTEAKQFLHDRVLSQFSINDSIVNTISKGPQSVDLDCIEVFTHKDGRVQKLKYSISSSSSYVFDSHAWIHVWDKTSNDWHLVYSIPPSKMNTKSITTAGPDSRQKVLFSHFEDDFCTLRHAALQIVF